MTAIRLRPGLGQVRSAIIQESDDTPGTGKGVNDVRLSWVTASQERHVLSTGARGFACQSRTAHDPGGIRPASHYGHAKDSCRWNELLSLAMTYLHSLRETLIASRSAAKS